MRYPGLAATTLSPVSNPLVDRFALEAHVSPQADAGQYAVPGSRRSGSESETRYGLPPAGAPRTSRREPEPPSDDRPVRLFVWPSGKATGGSRVHFVTRLASATTSPSPMAYRVVTRDDQSLGVVERLRYERHAEYPEEIVIRSGRLFWKRNRHIPFDAVESVDSRQRRRPTPPAAILSRSASSTKLEAG